ncbi:hypothetical protein LIA77_03498 [Sarocladium implicatum]|nr:hypothetical protein LIA77_03498 [Sarocladium implicatum]
MEVSSSCVLDAIQHARCRRRRGDQSSENRTDLSQPYDPKDVAWSFSRFSSWIDVAHVSILSLRCRQILDPLSSPLRPQDQTVVLLVREARDYPEGMYIMSCPSWADVEIDSQRDLVKNVAA